MQKHLTNTTTEAGAASTPLLKLPTAEPKLYSMLQTSLPPVQAACTGLRATEPTWTDAPEAPVCEAVPDVSAWDAVPDVSAWDAEPDVSAWDAEPDISAWDAEPDVSAWDAEPDVSAWDAEPDVSAWNAEPDVPAWDAEPDISARDAEPDVSAWDAEPDVSAWDAVPEAPAGAAAMLPEAAVLPAALPLPLQRAIGHEMAAKKLAVAAEAAHGTTAARALNEALPESLLSGSEPEVTPETLLLWLRELTAPHAPFPADASAALVVSEARRDLRYASVQDTLAATAGGKWTPLDDHALCAPLDPVDPVPLPELGQAPLDRGIAPLAEPLPQAWRWLSLWGQKPLCAHSLPPTAELEAQLNAAFAGDEEWAVGPSEPPDAEGPYLSPADLAWIAAGWDAPSSSLPEQLPLKEQVRRREREERERTARSDLVRWARRGRGRSSSDLRHKRERTRWNQRCGHPGAVMRQGGRYGY